MRQDEALAIVSVESLTDFVWFEEPTNRANVVGIGRDGERWWTYTTDERAAVHGAVFFDDEEAALDDFIERLRALDRMMRWRARRRGQ
ncbi:hypothetical protein AB1K54_16015 [Microbacterium sp. BWT-B31]|uniref:hypothetical protein n=1 Tax=Microbacterium sp. BWT-B31 TaxID=3232072 RepID=UPI003527A81B